MLLVCVLCEFGWLICIDIVVCEWFDLLVWVMLCCCFEYEGLVVVC